MIIPLQNPPLVLEVTSQRGTPSAIRRVRALDDCRAYLLEWEAFADSLGQVPPFARPTTWLRWLDAHPQYEASILNLHRDGELTAVLPLYIDDGKMRLIGDQHLDYQELFAVSEAAAVELFISAINHAAAQNLRLSLDKVAEGSMLGRVLKSPEVRNLATIHCRYWGSCPTATFDIPGDKTFFSSLSKNKRSAHRSATNRLKRELPEMQFQFLSGAEVTREAIEAVAVVHIANQYRKLGDSIFKDEAFVNFLVEEAASNETFRLSLLWEKPGQSLIGFIVGYWQHGTYSLYLTAYEGKHERLSPGRWLFVETLSACAQTSPRSCLHLDLLTGLDSYKMRWASHYYEIDKVQVIPRKSGFAYQRLFYRALYTAKRFKERLRKRFRPDGRCRLERVALVS